MSGTNGNIDVTALPVLGAGQLGTIVGVSVDDNGIPIEPVQIPATTFKGDPGSAGPTGAVGPTPVIAAAATPLPAGSPPTAVVSGDPATPLITFGQPAGPKGDTGPPGPQGTSPTLGLGNWNASTNVPALASGVAPAGGVVGSFYTCTVAGSTTLDGNTYASGDAAVWGGTTWGKISNATTQALVASANTQAQIDAGLVPSIGGPVNGMVLDSAGNHRIENLNDQDPKARIVGSDTWPNIWREDTVTGYSHAGTPLVIDDHIFFGSTDVVSEGREYGTLQDGLTTAWALGASTAILRINTVVNSFVTHIPMASFLLPRDVVVNRANRLERNITDSEIFNGSINFLITVLQGAALMSPSLRSHQEILSIEIVGVAPGANGPRIWGVFHGLNATPGGPNAELPGLYIVLIYSDDDGVTWTECMQITIGVPTTDAVVDTHLLFWNNRLWLFFGARRVGTLYDYFGGVRCICIENPMAVVPAGNPNALVFVTSAPFLIAYGDMQTPPQIVGGIPYANTTYTPQGGYPANVSAAWGYYVSRLWLDNYVGRPTAERAWLVPFPAITPTGDGTSGLTFLVRTDGSVMAIFRTPANGDYVSYSNVMDPLHPENTTWSAPIPWTGTVPCMSASRAAMGRSPSGRAYRVWNKTSDPGTRNNMTIAFSEDDGATWPYQFVIDAVHAPISYPCVRFIGDKVYVSFDYGRGQGAGTPKILYLNKFSEAAVIAGTAVNTQIVVRN